MRNPLTHSPLHAEEISAQEVRRLRAEQALRLFYVSIVSIVSGATMLVWPLAVAIARPFLSAVGLEFIIWGAIDLIFAIVGLRQSSRAAKLHWSEKTVLNELAGRDRLLRALRFNQKLNTSYLVVAAALLIASFFAKSAVLFGNGCGVLIQGGFLFGFDWYYIRAFDRTRRHYDGTDPGR